MGGSLNQDNTGDDSARQDSRPKTNQRDNTLNRYNINQKDVSAESGREQFVTFLFTNLMFVTERSVKKDEYGVLRSLSQRLGTRHKTKSNTLDSYISQNGVNTLRLTCGKIMPEGLLENSEETKRHLAMVKDGTEINIHEYAILKFHFSNNKKLEKTHTTYRIDTELGNIDLPEIIEIFAIHGTSYSQRYNNQGLVLVFEADSKPLQTALLSENIDNKMKTALENMPSQIFAFLKRLSAWSPTPSKITMDMLREAAKQVGLEAMFTGIEGSNQSLRYVLLFPDDCRLFLWIPTTDDSFISRKERLYLVSFPRRVNGSNVNKLLHR